MVEPIEMPFRFWTRIGSRNHVLDGGPDLPLGRGNLGEGVPTVKYMEILPCAVQKRLNRSICRLGCGLGLTEGSMFNRIR